MNIIVLVLASLSFSPSASLGGQLADAPRVILLAERDRLTHLLERQAAIRGVPMVIIGGALLTVGAAPIAWSSIVFGGGVGAGTTGGVVWLGLIVLGGALIIPGVILVVIGVVRLIKSTAERRRVEEQIEAVDRQLARTEARRFAPHGITVATF